VGEKKKRRLAEAEAQATRSLMPMPEAESETEPGAAREADTESQDSETEPDGAAPAAHPEEMRATVSLRIGNTIRLRASARATPAGIVAGAIAISAVTVPLIWLSRRR
jgi:hypothetical protein